MKVLFLWNTAGVFSPVARWLNENGHQAKIVMRDSLDPFHQTATSGCGVMVNSARDFYTTSIKLIRSFKPDIIHLSSVIPLLVVSRVIAPRTPVVLTYHGADVRNPTGRPHPQSRLADFIHVTTPDLDGKYGHWIERPLDQMFYDRGGRVFGTALSQYASFWFEDTRPLAEKWCQERGIKLTMMDRSDPKYVPVPYPEMPEYLSRFEYYLDFKGHGATAFALSKTALEAIACGCKVVHDRDLNEIIRTVKTGAVADYIQLYENMGRVPLKIALKRVPYTLYALMQVVTGRIPNYSKGGTPQ